MRLISGLLLVIVMSCLSGCGSTRPSSSCDWVEPIHLHDDTIRFLNDHLGEWPDGLVEDLNAIDKHNIKCKEILGK